MKIVSILGSPHPNGNTGTILTEVERPFKDAGHEVTRYCLGEKEINFCLGCKQCYKSGHCVQNDDVPAIINDLLESNLVIVASPSYWGDVTGQMKVFIDRCTPYCNVRFSEQLSGSNIKGIALAVRAGRNKAENENLVGTIEHFLGHLNIPLVSCLTVEGIDTADDLKAKPEVLSTAYELGKSMVDMIEDQALLAIAEARLKKGSGETISFEDILVEDGLTLADIDAMEDVEIE